MACQNAYYYFVHNDNAHQSESERLISYWWPSGSEVLFYFVVSTVLFGILNAETLWQFFNTRVLGADISVSSDYSPLTAPLFNFINNHDTPVMLVIWGVIGCVVFGLILGVQNVFKTAKQEIAESRYKVGGVSVNRDYWHSVARLDISFGAMAIGWIVTLVLYLNGIISWVSHEFFNGLNSGWPGGYKILLALFFNTAALYLIVKFTHVLLSTWRLIRPIE